MKRAGIFSALCLAISAPISASEAVGPLQSDGLTGESLLPGQVAPGDTRMALRTLSYRALGTFGLNPDWMGPAGCGYHAMLDSVAYAADTAGFGPAMRRGMVMVGGAMDLRAQLCPMTTVLSQGIAELGGDGTGLLDLAICREADPG